MKYRKRPLRCGQVVPEVDEGQPVPQMLLCPLCQPLGSLLTAGNLTEGSFGGSPWELSWRRTAADTHAHVDMLGAG